MVPRKTDLIKWAFLYIKTMRLLERMAKTSICCPFVHLREKMQMCFIVTWMDGSRRLKYNRTTIFTFSFCIGFET